MTVSEGENGERPRDEADESRDDEAGEGQAEESPRDSAAEGSASDDEESSASEHDESSASEDDEPHPALERARAVAEEEAARLQGGSQIAFFGGTLPVRGLVAMGLFLVIFMIAWVGLWAALGGLGLALGWIPAALVAVAAVVLIGRALWSSPARPAQAS